MFSSFFFYNGLVKWVHRCWRMFFWPSIYFRSIEWKGSLCVSECSMSSEKACFLSKKSGKKWTYVSIWTSWSKAFSSMVCALFSDLSFTNKESDRLFSLEKRVVSRTSFDWLKRESTLFWKMQETPIFDVYLGSSDKKGKKFMSWQKDPRCLLAHLFKRT